MIMKLFPVFVLLLSFAGMAVSSSYGGEMQADVRFMTVLQDVPLMPGLKEQVDESVVFDKPSGRIAESIAYGRIRSTEEIERFYRQTLPQLGWSSMSDRSFVRDDERLRITVAEAENYNVVTFRIRPR